MMTRRFCAAVFLVASCVSALAQTAAPTTPNAGPEAPFPMPPADWLLVQTATSVTYDGKVLTLKGVAPGTIMFSDRPQRMTGNVATLALVDEWNKGQHNFEKDPPNANLSMLVGGKEQNTIVELTNPKLSGDTLTYDARLLAGEIPTTSGPATLFIDWWEGPNGGVCRHYGPWHTVHCEPSYGRYPRTAPGYGQANPPPGYGQSSPPPQ
jgi:hypothetical protein